MSRVRHGQHEWADQPSRPVCAFCWESIAHGAAWLGAVEVGICRSCASTGKLGLLLGDVADDSADIARLLEATAREAWRSLALARERDEARAMQARAA